MTRPRWRRPPANGARRSAAGLLAGAMVLALVVPASADATDPGGTFVDDDGGPHEGFIEAVAVEGITRGCNPPDNDRFCPTDPVTREQMAAFVVRARGYVDGAGADLFVDDDGRIFENDIDLLATAGVTRGCNPPDNDRFCPTSVVTRGQMAAFVGRAFGYESGTGDDRFTDDDRSAFEDDIDRLAAAGVTLGCNPPANDRFCPDAAVTRAEMATFLGRAMGLTRLDPPARGLPLAGNPAGDAPVPSEARAADVSDPDHVIGSGTAASCTSQAVVDAVAQGGVIVFDCGPDPVTIEMNRTAKVRNDRDPDVVIDGGGLITLSGGGDTRILYMNTCDPDQVWTTPHCQDQDHPRLVVQNLTFTDGFDAGTELQDGGGAIWSRGGRIRIVNSNFFSNTCTSTGPDVGGAVRVFDQSQDRPVFVVNSTFGGTAERGNSCSNGGALSSIGVSWTIINSVLTHNSAVGIGANPARSGTPGGGNGGAMAFDGNTYDVRILDTIVEDNTAREGGGGVFFVSNDRSGTLTIDGSTLRRNTSERFETIPGIFYLGRGDMRITASTIE